MRLRQSLRKRYAAGQLNVASIGERYRQLLYSCPLGQGACNRVWQTSLCTQGWGTNGTDKCHLPFRNRSVSMVLASQTATRILVTVQEACPMEQPRKLLRRSCRRLMA